MIGINDACEILSWAYNNNIEIWLDGGWGVDALLGKETRQHNDIDLFVEEKNYNKFIEIIDYIKTHDHCKIISCKGENLF